MLKNRETKKMSNYSVNSSQGATDMHFGVKPTFTPHNLSEKTEKLCFVILFFLINQKWDADKLWPGMQLCQEK